MVKYILIFLLLCIGCDKPDPITQEPKKVSALEIIEFYVKANSKLDDALELAKEFFPNKYYYILAYKDGPDYAKLEAPDNYTFYKRLIYSPSIFYETLIIDIYTKNDN